jgi:RNA polymerase sigma factor (sigma-70 family)
MSADQPRDVLGQLRRAALLRDGAGMTDGQLLGRFVADRDGAAFAALVRRHGPMVLGACRRVLRHEQDAEDAFQATFLVLARKAASVGRRELLGNWLYGVAHRTALDARAAAARRRARERQVSPMPEPEVRDGADAGPDLRPLLDQELSRLPDKYRVPVVLCDLEGRTRREVARQLGIPVGTLSGRLTTSRRMLARRLARRGLALSGAALTAALSPSAASAGVPPPLVAATVAAATAQAAGVASARIAALAEGVLKAMLVKKLKIVTAVLLAAGLVVGAALLAHQPIAAQPSAEGARKKAGPPAAALNVGGPRVLNLPARGRRVVWSPDGKTLAVVTKVEKFFLNFKVDGRGSAIELWDVEKGRMTHTLAESREKGLAFQQVAFSADGKSIAATATELTRRAGSAEIHDVVKVWDAKTLELKKALGGDSQLVCVALSPDGKLVAAGDPARKVVNLWSAATGKLERALRTEGAQPWSVAFSPDGKALVVGGQAGGSGEVTVWEVGTGKLKHTLETEKFVNAVAFSPDGRLVGAGIGGEAVHVWDVEKGEEVVSLKGSQGGHRTVAFAPDGKTVAAGGRDGKVRLWDARTGELRAMLKGHGAEVFAIAFAPDGRTLASTSQDQTVRLWPINPRAAGKK